MSSIFAVGLAVSLRPVSYWLAWSTIVVVLCNIYASLLGVSLTEAKAHGLVVPISTQQRSIRPLAGSNWFSGDVQRHKRYAELWPLSAYHWSATLPVPAGSLRARMRAPRPAGMQDRLLACLRRWSSIRHRPPNPKCRLTRVRVTLVSCPRSSSRAGCTQLHAADVTRKRRVLEQAMAGRRWGWAMNHRVYASLVLRWLWTLPNGKRSGPDVQKNSGRKSAHDLWVVFCHWARGLIELWTDWYLRGKNLFNRESMLPPENTK